MLEVGQDYDVDLFVVGNRGVNSVRGRVFGSYGWGTGDWMETWKQRALDAGANLIGTAIVNETAF